MKMRFASTETVDVKKKITFGIIFFIVIFAIDRNNFKYFQFFRSFIGDASIYTSKAVNYPFSLVSKLSKNIGEYFENDKIITIQDLEKMKIEISDLKNKNKTLNIRNQYLNSIIGEEQYVYKSQIAKTIIYKNNAFNNVFSLNKGSADSVRIGDPVIKNNVLIGKIIKTNFKSSIAVLLTNINSRVPVRIGTKKFTAILVGSPGSINNLKLTFLPKEYSFNNGDLIYTSGIDGLLPEKLLIGEIQLNKNNQHIVKPFYEKNNLDLVSIINLGEESVK